MKKLFALLMCTAVLTVISCEDEPYEGDALTSGLTCETAVANTAQAALNFLSVNDDNYSQLCVAYRNALQAQIQACGDTDGSLQAAINAIGDCTVTVENDCDGATEAVNIAESAFDNATPDNYTSLCTNYKAALENQIVQCGDETGAIQAEIDALGNCINSSMSSAEFYVTGLFNGSPIVMETGTSDNYLPGDGSGFTSLNFGDNNCRIGYKGTVASSLPFNESPAGSISFDYFYVGGCSYTNESSVFNSIFTSGNYEALDVEGNLEEGMHMEYYPTGLDGEWYTSALEDQSGSQFEITNSESANYTLANGFEVYRQTVTGTFNCTLYDSSGNSIEVTNGTFRVIVSQYFE